MIEEEYRMYDDPLARLRIGTEGARSSQTHEPVE